jgi:hypothetical protein
VGSQRAPVRVLTAGSVCVACDQEQRRAPVPPVEELPGHRRVPLTPVLPARVEKDELLEQAPVVESAE